MQRAASRLSTRQGLWESTRLYSSGVCVFPHATIIMPFSFCRVFVWFDSTRPDSVGGYAPLGIFMWQGTVGGEWSAWRPDRCTTCGSPRYSLNRMLFEPEQEKSLASVESNHDFLVVQWPKAKSRMITWLLAFKGNFSHFHRMFLYYTIISYIYIYIYI